MNPQQQKFSSLIASVYTVHDLNEKIQFLKNYLKVQIFGNRDTKSFNTDDLTWIESQKELIADITKDNIDLVFESFEKQLKQIKPLVMFIPTEFPPTTIKDLSSKLRQSYGPNFLIDLKLDPNLIAGCALVWNGVYKDYSIRARINESKDDVLGILKKWK